MKRKPKAVIPDPEHLYSTREAAVRTGCTLRQLQWWDEKRLMVPERAYGDHRRAYSEADIKRLKNISRLKRCGVSLQAVRSILKTKAFQGDMRFLLIEGKRVWESPNESAVIAVLRATEKPMLLIDRGE